MNPERWQEERFELALRLVEESCELSRNLQDKLGGDYFNKIDSSPVTLADLAVQALAGIALRRHFPEDSLLGEETTETLNEAVLVLIKDQLKPYLGDVQDEDILACFRSTPRANRRWILDPIDGTKGFLRGDQFAVALAHQIEATIEFGLLGCPRLALDSPSRGEGCVGVAFRGRGAWQKKVGAGSWKRIHVSGQSDVTQARLLRSFEASHTNEQEIEALVSRLHIQAEPVRMDSQAKSLILARGDAEAVIRCLSPDRPDYKEKLWDQAAGWMLVSEAGGRVTDLRGEGLDFSGEARLEKNVGVLATNERLQRSLLAEL